MRVVLSAAGVVRLDEVADFKRLSLVIEPQPEAAARRLLSTIARPEGEDHAWLHPEVLRALAGRCDAPWLDGLQAMADFARSRGWTNAEGALRVHIERPEPAQTASIEAFKAAMRNLAGAVSVLATGQGAQRYGMTVSSLTALCAEPPCLLVCVNRNARAHDPLLENRCFSLSILADGQDAIARRFAGMDANAGAARFTDPDWQTGRTGAPVLASAIASFDCQLVSQQAVGTHSLLIGQIVHCEAREALPLVNFRGRMQALAAS